MQTRIHSMGALFVPRGTNTDDFAEMEALFRPKLWPQGWDGWRMLSRQLVFNRERTRLHYTIIQYHPT